MSRCRVPLRCAERPDHSEVDHELELGRQPDRQIARLFALEDAAGVDARQAMVLVGIRSIAHESARGSELESREERGNRMTCRQHDKLLRAGEEERIGRESDTNCRD